MTVADRKAFALLMAGLAETFAEELSDARMAIYWGALEHLDIETVRAAANTIVRTSTFFPRPAEILNAAAGNVEDRAEMAWNAVVNLVRRVGYPGVDGRGKAPEFPDEATRRAALELFGGWVALCEQLPGAGSPAFIGTAKQFRALYGAYARRDAALPPGETGRELSHGESVAGLTHIKTALDQRGLPTGKL